MYGHENGDRNAEYFVLYDRDLKTERSKEYGETMLFDQMKYFHDLASARSFAMRQLPAIVAKRECYHPSKDDELRDPSKPYVIAAEHYGKYTSSCMGETDSLKTYDARRCGAADVESIMEKMLIERTARCIVGGLELKLL
jgi:hypothetical protein